MTDTIHDDDSAFSRNAASGMSKCTEAVKIWLTPEIDAKARARAASVGASTSEIGRDLFFMWLEGVTYGEYVAKHRRDLIVQEGADKGRNAPDFHNLRVLDTMPAAKKARAA